MAKKKKIVLRKDAILQSKTVYYTGKPCKNGHDDFRYVTSGTCIECQRLSRLAERAFIKQVRNQSQAVSNG